MLKRSQPIFAVRDVKATIAFYQTVLGFESPWFWGDPVCFGGIGWADVHVMFNQQPAIAANVEGLQHHYWAEEIDALHARHVASGAPIIEAIGNRPWGVREYTVRDPDGYHLRFTGPQLYEKPPTASESIPDFIRIEPRLATADEYMALIESVNWRRTATSHEILARSLMGATAIDTRTGQAVGMARAMEDAASWYSIWDVVVRPEFQSQRIGSAVVESLVAQLRERGPSGANVFLFTMSHPFYARLGFRNDGCSMLKL